VRLPTDRDLGEGTPGVTSEPPAGEIPANSQYVAPEQPEATGDAEPDWVEGEPVYEAAAGALAPDQAETAWEAVPTDEVWAPAPEQSIPALEYAEADVQPLVEEGAAPEAYDAPPENQVGYGYPVEAETGYGYPQDEQAGYTTDEQVVYQEDAQVYYEQQAAPETPQPEPVYEEVYESPAEPVVEAEFPAEPTTYEPAEAPLAYEPEPVAVVPEASAEVADQDAWTFAQQQEAAAAEQASAAPEAEVGAAQPLDDPIAASGLYIPGDVEYLEGDMPTYGDNEKVASIFKGEGLGEPLFVDFGDLARMITGLRKILPAGTRLTYNFDYQRAWIRATGSVDLPAYAESVRALMWEGEQTAQQEPAPEASPAAPAVEAIAAEEPATEAPAPEQAAPQPPASEPPSA
jgi:hypothetical protein